MESITLHTDENESSLSISDNSTPTTKSFIEIFQNKNQKEIFIKEYIVDYPEQRYINSKFSFIVLIFNDACKICFLSLLEAKKFDYFRAVFRSEMKNELNKFIDNNNQYYYIVPFYMYEGRCSLTLEIFNRLHSCTISLHNKTIEEIIKNEMNISDISLQEKLQKDLDDLYKVLGFNPT